MHVRLLTVRVRTRDENRRVEERTRSLFCILVPTPQMSRVNSSLRTILEMGYISI